MIHADPPQTNGGNVTQHPWRTVHVRAVAVHRKDARFVDALAAQQVPVLDQFVAAQNDLSVVGDGFAVNFGDHVSGPQGSVESVRHAGEQDAVHVVRNFVIQAQGLVFQFVPVVAR